MKKIDKYFGNQKIPFPGLRRIIFPLAAAVFVVLGSVEIDWYEYDLTPLLNFCTVFLGIVMQAFPFLMAGTLVSSVINEFVKDKTVENLFRKNSFLSIPAALTAAFLFPVCDCASVPVAARFCRKGFPLSSSVVFMLASPIINPVVIASTWYAFGDFKVLFVRIALGIIIPSVIGVSAQRIFKNMPILSSNADDVHGIESCSCHDHSGCGHHDHGKQNIFDRLMNILNHMGGELVSVLPFIIIGALVSSGIQTFVPKNILFGGAAGIILQTGLMVAAALLLSICSTSDAFFARAFLSHVSIAPAIAFMTAGPMIDIKNILMMSQYFKKRFIVFIALSVVISVSIASIILAASLFGGI